MHTESIATVKHSTILLNDAADSLSQTVKRKLDDGTDTAQRSIQIVAGSYDRTLLGLVATVDVASHSCTFSTNFLFNAHAASIRSLAISPTSASPDRADSSRRLIATGGADEKINVFQISAASPPQGPPATSLQPPNRELGALLHHSSTVTALTFPSKGKLLSASLDNSIAVSRLRDWTLLSTIRAPSPKIHGRPSGDTAAYGDAPAGIVAIAVHPSAKLCLSVSQGEKSMRLWNLVSGKREGVLTFDKTALEALGDTRWRGGEARSIVFSPDGEEFAIGLEHGAMVYGLDCELRGIARSSETKVSQIKYGFRSSNRHHYLAMSTENGLVLFFDTTILEMAKVSQPAKDETSSPRRQEKVSVREFDLVAQLGTATRGTRIKDFVILSGQDPAEDHYLVTCSSNGNVALWSLDSTKLPGNDYGTMYLHKTNNRVVEAYGCNSESSGSAHVSIGTLLGSYETGKRVTCMGSFVMGNDAIIS